MHEFNTPISEVNATTCSEVSMANWITNWSSDEWRQAHQETYHQATAWKQWHLSDPKLSKLYNDCERLNYNRHQRGKRMNAFVSDALTTQDCCLVTLTFTDYALSNTNKTTRRQRVNEFFRKHSVCYCFNDDYGSKNGREHYHGLVVGISKIDAKMWQYGAVKGETVRNNSKDSPKIAKYINKITNHSTKDTVKSRITYSRVKPCSLVPSDWWFNKVSSGYEDSICPF